MQNPTAPTQTPEYEKDRTLVAGLWLRQEEALQTLISRFGKLCTAIARNLLGNEQDAEECANDTYLRIWNSIPPNRPENLCAYVSKLARRTAIDRYRANTRQCRCRETEILLSEMEDCAAEMAAENEEISPRFASLLDRFLRRLDPQNRVLFIRRYFYGESVSALAARFALPVNTVSARLLRARKKLQMQLKKEGIRK